MDISITVIAKAQLSSSIKEAERGKDSNPWLVFQEGHLLTYGEFILN